MGILELMAFEVIQKGLVGLFLEVTVLLVTALHPGRVDVIHAGFAGFTVHFEAFGVILRLSNSGREMGRKHIEVRGFAR
jgi:hypothetical protein